jgi:hypothetical protein
LTIKKKIYERIGPLFKSEAPTDEAEKDKHINKAIRLYIKDNTPND